MATGNLHTNLVESNFWCSRVKACFDLFSENPSSLHHLLLYGPPGSGKTTAAHWLVNKIWGNYQSLMSMSMNAADERSLDSIRQKALPFFRMDWRTKEIVNKEAPRFLILDECETLTEPAQMSLTNILDSDPRDFCLIIICNSLSKIHPKLRNRLLKIRFDPPNQKLSKNTTIFDEITRGDLRISKNSPTRDQEIKYRLWNLINPDVKNISSMGKVDINQKIIELYLLYHLLDLIEENECLIFNNIYTIVEKASSDTIYLEEYNNLVGGLKHKIEKLFDN